MELSELVPSIWVSDHDVELLFMTTSPFASTAAQKGELEAVHEMELSEFPSIEAGLDHDESLYAR